MNHNLIFETNYYKLSYCVDNSEKVVYYCADEYDGNKWSKRLYRSIDALIRGEKCDNKAKPAIELIIEMDNLMNEFSNQTNEDFLTFEKWVQSHEFTFGIGEKEAHFDFNPASAQEIGLVREWISFILKYYFSLY